MVFGLIWTTIKNGFLVCFCVIYAYTMWWMTSILSDFLYSMAKLAVNNAPSASSHITSRKLNFLSLCPWRKDNGWGFYFWCTILVIMCLFEILCCFLFNFALIIEPYTIPLSSYKTWAKFSVTILPNNNSISRNS